ncbi:putative tRNA (guanine-N(7)-)-methyltransferase subunit TRM82 [Paratrimastix pyriformis]|uniref:tRNA (Guanine-N(7)-)-methyltransferase subunit TRM82 n=1 Tax=Paratrimastix pyriformis TaxID=342808 RepID=A0ABQ8U8L1_9EUKA|nr:putative tRNA (guanine-N(7)-)-methyltransferase subunit TRM82 [Paratrimastix pyriformis]
MPRYPVLVLSFAPDGSKVAFSVKNKVFVYDFGTRKFVNIPNSGHESTITSVSWSPDGHFLATCADEKQICVYTAMSGFTSQLRRSGSVPHCGPKRPHNLMQSYRTFSAVRKKISSMVFSSTPAGPALLFSDKLGDVWGCNPTSLTHPFSYLLGHCSSVTQMVLSTDGQYLMTSEKDEKIRVSHFPQCFDIASFCLGHTQSVPPRGGAGWALGAGWVLAGCWLGAGWVLAGCWLGAGWVLAGCWLGAGWVLAGCWLGAGWVLAGCWLGSEAARSCGFRNLFRASRAHTHPACTPHVRLPSPSTRAVTALCLATVALPGGPCEVLVSGSVDGSLRVWHFQSGTCLGLLESASSRSVTEGGILAEAITEQPPPCIACLAVNPLRPDEVAVLREGSDRKHRHLPADPTTATTATPATATTATIPPPMSFAALPPIPLAPGCCPLHMAFAPRPTPAPPAPPVPHVHRDKKEKKAAKKAEAERIAAEGPAPPPPAEPPCLGELWVTAEQTGTDDDARVPLLCVFRARELPTGAVCYETSQERVTALITTLTVAAPDQATVAALQDAHRLSRYRKFFNSIRNQKQKEEEGEDSKAERKRQKQQKKEQKRKQREAAGRKRLLAAQAEGEEAKRSRAEEQEKEEKEKAASEGSGSDSSSDDGEGDDGETGMAVEKQR